MDTTRQKRSNPYRKLREVEELVREFESCALPLEKFRHHAHLTVTLFYLSRMNTLEATCRVREGLQRLIAHYGVNGYNETLTQFWLRLVQHFLAESRSLAQQRPLPFVELLDGLVERYGDSRLIYNFYTRELLMSETAQAAWVEPDLKPLDL